MNCKVSAMVGGDAVAYAVVDCESISNADTIAFSARAHRKPLPCGTYEVTGAVEGYISEYVAGENRACDLLEGVGAGTRRYIVTLPLIDAPVLLTAHFGNCQGRKAARPLVILPLNHKVLSRIRRTRRSQPSQAVLNYEKGIEERQVRFLPHHVLPTQDESQTIIKGIIDAPAGCNIQASPLLRDGKPGDISMRLDPPRLCIVDGRRREQISFSARINNETECACIVFHASDDHAARPAFLPLNPAYFASLGCADTFYRLLDDERYHIWRRIEAKKGLREYPASSASLAFSVIALPGSLTRDGGRGLIGSILDQSHTAWELILMPGDPAQLDALKRFVATHGNARIRVLDPDPATPLPARINQAMEDATGDFVCLIDQPGFLDCDALSEYATYMTEKPQTDVLYCDEDVYSGDRGFHDPQFKSDFNPDLLRATDYIGQFTCIRRSVALSAALQDAVEDAYHYDAMLRLSEKTDAFGHVARVLFHGLCGSELAVVHNRNSDDAGCTTLQAHLDRTGTSGHAQRTSLPSCYRIDFDFPEKPLVSIIIPNKDNASYLRMCVESIELKTTWPNLEIVIVENNSTSQEIFALYDELQHRFDNVRVVTWEHEFNYPKINNFGAQHAHGEYLLLLNNDTTVIAPGWIEAMLGYCRRQDVGAVGAKLLYPDDTIQHAGVMMMAPRGDMSLPTAVHIYQHHEKEWQGSCHRAQLPQDLMAVTAACMMVSRAAYDQVGGLTEEFTVAYNDVDFCLKLRQAGLLVVYTPEAVLHHFESASRGSDFSESGRESHARFLREFSLLGARWSTTLYEPDPYFGPISQILI